MIFTTDTRHFLSKKHSVMDLKTVDVKAHLHMCPSPAGYFPGYPKGAGACVSWVAECITWEIALWVRKRNVCDACQDPEHPREFELSLMSHTEANCSRRDFSLLASTYQVVLKAERIHQMLILKMKFDLCMASFALPFLLTQKRVNICYSQAPVCLLQIHICMKLSTTKAFWQ